MELSLGRHAAGLPNSRGFKWVDAQPSRAASRLPAALPAVPSRRPGPGDSEDGALAQHGPLGGHLGSTGPTFPERRFADASAPDLRHDVRSSSVASHVSAAQLVWEGGAEGAPFPEAASNYVLSQLKFSVKQGPPPPSPHKAKPGPQTQQESSSWEWSCISEGNPCVILEDSAEQTNLEDVFMNADAQTHRLGVIEPPSADPRQADFNVQADFNPSSGGLPADLQAESDFQRTSSRLHADFQAEADFTRSSGGLQADFNPVLDSAHGSFEKDWSPAHEGEASAGSTSLHANARRQVNGADMLRFRSSEPFAGASFALSDNGLGPARASSRESSGSPPDEASNGATSSGRSSPEEGGGVAGGSESSASQGRALPLYRRVGTPEGLEPEFESDSELSDDGRCGNCGKPLAFRPVHHTQKAAQRPIPTIFPLTSAALRALIPASGSGTQVLESLGGPADWLRRFVASMGGAVLFYNLNPILTILAAFYWAWGPLWAAALSNMALRARYPYAGLWVARLRKLQVETGPRGEKKWRLLIGDKAGVAVELVADAPSLAIRLRPGEPVQMVAVSDTPTFSRFRVLREAFLPRRGVWLAQQNVVERPVFESLQVHLVPAVLNKMPSQDEEDWDSQYTMMCDETNETVRQYNYDHDGLEMGPEMPFGIMDADGIAPGYGACDCASDLGLSAMFADPLDAEAREYRDV